MYWVWATEPDVETDAQIEECPAIMQESDLQFNVGTRMAAQVPTVVFELTPDLYGALTDDLYAPGARGLVLSRRLCDLLRSAGVDNVDYYPCIIRDLVKGQDLEGYSIANVIGCVSCLDLDSSVVSQDSLGNIFSIQKMAIDESRALGLLVFRLAEFPPLVIVHESVKSAVMAAGMTGLKFYKPEEFVV